MPRIIGTNVHPQAGQVDKYGCRIQQFVHQPHGLEHNHEFRIARYWHYDNPDEPIDGYITRLEEKFFDDAEREWFWNPVPTDSITHALLAQYSRLVPLNDEDDTAERPHGSFSKRTGGALKDIDVYPEEVKILRAAAEIMKREAKLEAWLLDAAAKRIVVRRKQENE